MQKRVYRGTPLAKFKVETIWGLVADRRLVFGVDVGKEVMAGAFMTEEREVLANVTWQNPWQTMEVLGLLGGLPARVVEVALEPSGTYGDPFRYRAQREGFPIYRVSAKRSHDAAEVYDGVKSWHDVKAAGVVARLHLDGASHEWRERTEDERELAAAVRVLTMHDVQAHNNTNRLEALLSRHWPEVTAYLGLGRVTLCRLLETGGGPRWVAEDPDRARKEMRRWGRRLLRAEVIEKVVASASTTIGVPMVPSEERMVREVAAEVWRCREAARGSQAHVEDLVVRHREAIQMAPVIGRKTAAVLVARGMNPVHYSSPPALLKAMGISLKERSSGKYKGELKITKRGPGICRFYLYMAVLRLIVHEPVIRDWYNRKVARDGGTVKNKAIIALMRKLVKALWHVARGEPFDPLKLVAATG